MGWKWRSTDKSVVPNCLTLSLNFHLCNLFGARGCEWKFKKINFNSQKKTFQLILPKYFGGKKRPQFLKLLATYYFIHSVGSFFFVVITFFYWPFSNFRCEKFYFIFIFLIISSFSVVNQSTRRLKGSAMWRHFSLTIGFGSNSVKWLKLAF